jgi:type VI secretion system secreted protein Hcp
MRRISKTLWAVALSFTPVLVALPAFGSVFVRIDGVEGESTDDKHKSEIVVEALTIRERIADTGRPGPAAARVALQDFQFTKKVDKASAKISSLVAKGSHIKSASIELDSGAKVTWRAVLSDVVLTSYKPIARSAGAAPTTEEVGLTAATYEVWSRSPLPGGAPGPWVKRNLLSARRELPSVFVPPPAAVAPPPTAAHP